MTQKELQEYRKIMRNAESIEYQIQKLQSQINKVTAIVNDMPRGGKSTDKSELICKLIDLQEQYKTEYSTAAEKLKTIETAIAELSDQQEQAVLRYKYILGLNENKICQRMHYERSRIYQIHKSALKKNCEFLKEWTKMDYILWYYDNVKKFTIGFSPFFLLSIENRRSV